MADSIDFPSSISAGLNFKAVLILPDYPAPAFAVSAIIRGPSVINLTATGNGSQHTFAVAADVTADWAPGDYWVSLRATSGADVFEVAKRQLVITLDLSAAAEGYDGRTQNEIALDSINAVIAKRATIDQQRYTINNRELWRTPMADLLKLRSFYSTAVRRERRRASGNSAFGRPIHVRFSQ